MSSVPSGWNRAPLRQVCDIVSGATPKTGVAEYWGGQVAWVTPNDLSKDRSQTVSHGERHLTATGYESCSARMFPAGSVIVSSRAPIGYVAIAGQPMCTNQGCKTAVPPDFIDSRYLYWYMLNAKPDLEYRASGTTFREISGKGFGETELVWPGLDEQRRIVDILEDHLSRLDAGTGLLDSLALRASAWSRSIIDGQVWQAKLARFHVAELLAEPMRNGHSAPAVRDGSSGIRTLTLTAVTRNAFTNEFTKITSADPHRVQSLWLRNGDLLVQRANTPELVGTTAMFCGEDDWAIYPDLLIRLRANHERVLSGYLCAVLRSERAHREMRSKAKGLAGSMPKIDQAAIGSTSVPLPDLHTQRVVLERLNEVHSGHERTTTAAVVAERRAELLRRALLAAAFSGRLTGRASDMEMVEVMADV